MAVFWDAGYAGTSLDDITASTGMNRPSLYGAFGDKHALYRHTLERYRASARAGLSEALAQIGRCARRCIASMTPRCRCTFPARAVRAAAS